MIKLFKVIGVLEGLSLLFLLFIAMPLKYKFGMPIYVEIIGSIHGFLFIAYIGLVLYFFVNKEWNFRKSILASVASIIPFGTFYFEKKIL